MLKDYCFVITDLTRYRMICLVLNNLLLIARKLCDLIPKPFTSFMLLNLIMLKIE